MRLLILFSAILLAACVSTKDNYYTSTITSWQGATANALVAQWGKPDLLSRAPDGSTLYVYKTERYSAVSGPANPAVGVTFTPGGHPVLTTNSNPTNPGTRGMTISCTTLFVIDSKNIITKVEARGTGCFANQSAYQRKRYMPSNG